MRNILYIMGYSAGAGKSSIAMGLLKKLKDVYGSENIVYVKPITQCLHSELLKYCGSHKITWIEHYVHFDKDYTLMHSNKTKEQKELVKNNIVTNLLKLSNKYKFVVVDGIGFPGVGSCCGISNVELAHAIDAGVLYIAPAGLGMAIDKMFEHIRFIKMYAAVLGIIFNKYNDNYKYSYDECKERILQFIKESNDKDINTLNVYGFVREHNYRQIDSCELKITSQASEKELDVLNSIVGHMCEYIDYDKIISSLIYFNVFHNNGVTLSIPSNALSKNSFKTSSLYC